jgi:hypothetical protein
MIREVEFYHGAVLAKIAHYNEQDVTIKPYPTRSRASYVINGNTGLYIKYSSNRMSPWTFSFADVHQDEILEMTKNLERVYVALVCGKDGVSCLSFDELKHVLNNVHDRNEWIRISRKPREKYAVKGSDGKLFFKIGDNQFPSRLFDDKSSHKKFIIGW